MKRITTLLLAVALAFGSVGAASADGIDVKVKGQWDFTFGWGVNTAFKDSYHGNTKSGDNDNTIARQRIRTQINFIASESLQGVLMFEIGTWDWGRGGSVGRGSGGGIDADGVNVETKRAYLDWIVPNTEISVRMGIQGLKLPSTPMGSPLFDADVAGILVSSPVTDWLSVSAFWIRPFDPYYNDDDDNDSFGKTRNLSDEVDAFGLLLPMTFDGIAVTPWAIYGHIGASSGLYDYLFNDGSHDNTVTAESSSTNVWWFGTHLELTMFDPLVFNLEAIYGRLGKANLGGFGQGWDAGFDNDGDLVLEYDPGFGDSNDSRVGTSGWFIGATLDYKLDWGTPGIFGWWSTGDKASGVDSGKLGRMPTIGNDGGSFSPTTFGTAGYWGVSDGQAVMGTGLGTWGLGIQLADVSFIEDLSHTLRVAYYRGTNENEVIRDNYALGGLAYFGDTLYMTDKDYAIEVNFDHKYDIYENLSAVLELGYIYLHADEDTWKGWNGGKSGDNLDENENAWKAQLSFQYKF